MHSSILFQSVFFSMAVGAHLGRVAGNSVTWTWRRGTRPVWWGRCRRLWRRVGTFRAGPRAVGASPWRRRSRRRRAGAAAASSRPGRRPARAPSARRTRRRCRRGSRGRGRGSQRGKRRRRRPVSRRWRNRRGDCAPPRRPPASAGRIATCTKRPSAPWAAAPDCGPVSTPVGRAPCARSRAPAGRRRRPIWRRCAAKTATPLSVPLAAPFLNNNKKCINALKFNFVSLESMQYVLTSILTGNWVTWEELGAFKSCNMISRFWETAWIGRSY